MKGLRAMSKKSYYTKMVILYSFVSFMYLLPALKNMEIFGFYDIAFHINRALGLESILRSPINFDTFRSYGIQVNNFYPWLTIYPLFLLIKITNLAIGYNLFLFFVTLVTLFICHYVMYTITKKNIASYLFAIVYTTSAFRSVEIFYRAALGELLAMSILPIILLGYFKLQESKKDSWILLSVSMTLLIYTHVLSAAMTVLMLMLALSFQFYQQRKISIRILGKLIKAAIVALLLSLAFIAPMIEQTLYQDLNRPYVDILQKRALLLAEQFLIGSIDSDLTLFGIGLVLLIFLTLLTINFRKLNSLSKFTFYMGIIALLLCTKIFPWFALQNTPLNIIQAPWRFMIFATLFISFSGSIFLSQNLKDSSLAKKRGLLLILIISVSSLNYSSVVNMSKQEDLEKPYSNSSMLNKLDSYENFDYAPKNYAKYKSILKNHQILENGKVINSTFSPKKEEILFTFNSTEGKKIVLPVFQYKGAVVTVNSKNVRLAEQSDSLITVESESGFNEVIVSYSYTTLSKVSLMLSLTTLIILFCYYLLLRSRTS